MKQVKKLSFTIILVIIMLAIISPIVSARGIIDPSDYDPNKDPIETRTVEKVTDVAGPIINAMAIIGIVLAAGALALIGIIYITSTLSEKAKYKETMMPYLVGVFMIVGITQLINFIYIIVKKIN